MPAFNRLVVLAVLGLSICVQSTPIPSDADRELAVREGPFEFEETGAYRHLDYRCHWAGSRGRDSHRAFRG